MAVIDVRYIQPWVDLPYVICGSFNEFLNNAVNEDSSKRCSPAAPTGFGHMRAFCGMLANVDELFAALRSEDTHDTLLASGRCTVAAAQLELNRTLTAGHWTLIFYTWPVQAT